MNAAATDRRMTLELATDPLVERCRAKDPAAFEMVYRQHAATIHQHLRALLDRSDVDDALQQTFAEAFKNLGKFAGRSKLSTWLHGIAVRVALNIRRSRRRRSSAMEFYVSEHDRHERSAATPESSLASQQMLAKLERYLERESGEHRAAFIMYYIEELPLAEVAAVLGRGGDATWAALKRTRARVVEAVERDVQRTRRRDTEPA